MDITNLAQGLATESAGVLSLGDTQDPNVFDVTIIREGWGSSGYYGPDLLKESVARFTKGTRSFLDHADGPVESAKTVVGLLESDARVEVSAEGKTELKAKMRFLDTGLYNTAWIKERAKHGIIELSQRSLVQYGQGTREGRFGKVVTRIDEGLSVDVVARGGAGGKFGVIQESALIGVGREESTKEGDDVPLTKDEITAIAQENAAAFAAAIKPTLDAVTSGLADLKTAQEAKAVEKTPLTAREINEKITTAKLSEEAAKRVYGVIEGKDVVPDDATVDSAIAQETARVAELDNEFKARLTAANIQFDESEGTIVVKGVSQESKPAEAGGVKRWGVVAK